MSWFADIFKSRRTLYLESAKKKAGKTSEFGKYCESLWLLANDHYREANRADREIVESVVEEMCGGCDHRLYKISAIAPIPGYPPYNTFRICRGVGYAPRRD